MHLAGQLEQLDPAVSEPAMELLDHLEAWHREALTRLAMALPPEAMDAVRTDPVVAHLFDTYLGEDVEEDPTGVVAEALEEIRPYVHSHGGEMEVAGVDVESGVVTLSLLGSCDGCPSSSVTLTQGVEAILRERWPGFRRLQVEGADEPTAPPQLLQIQSLRGR
jgi:Fe-S cluster biogenesis protein NfuA